VVGHSLGSVIAYDAVRLLWTRRYRDMVLPDTDDTSLMALALREAEQAGQRLAAAPPAGRAAAHAAYVAAQRQVQLVMRDLTGEDGPTRWIITDLVTLGCPLTYADAFMAVSPDDLADRFEERSLASIPPRSQQVHSAAAHPYRLWVPDGVAGRGTTRWHHAAPFVCVEWTNLWFEHDIVGGPIGPHFGDGVTDTSLGGTKWLAAFAFAYPHSSYWVASRKSLVRNGSLASLRFLRDKVRRPPTLLLTARTTPTDERQRAIVQLLAAGDPGRPVVDVRLYVGATDAQRTGSYLAVGRAPLPTAETAQRMRALLGPQGRVALLTSPDLLTDSADGEGVETVRRIDPSAPTLRSEEVEEDSLVVES
jgi:hypothetical protein